VTLPFLKEFAKTLKGYIIMKRWVIALVLCFAGGKLFYKINRFLKK
jgi:hypothetical protein